MKKDLWIIEKDGKRRKAKETICKNCKKPFLQRVKSQGSCCSTACSSFQRKVRSIVLCSNCGEKIEKTPSQIKAAKHNHFFCSRECKEKAQSMIGNCPDIRPEHYGKGNSRKITRRIFRQTKNPECCDCKETTKYLLVVHHIDGDGTNNRKENLEILCGTCHMKRHLKQKDDGEWVYLPSHLTPRHMLADL